MSKFIIDLWLDGYENEEEMINACYEFIYDQLNMTASSIKIIGQIKEQEESKDTFILYGGSQEVVEKQLICEHNWFGPCIDKINRFYKCTKCFCLKYNCTWENYLKYSEEDRIDETRIIELETVLKQIIDDLPEKRDWLDPVLEKISRKLLEQNEKRI